MANATIAMGSLARLRSLMADSSYVGKGLHAYLIPNTDAHQEFNLYFSAKEGDLHIFIFDKGKIKTEYLRDKDCRTHTVSGLLSRKATSIVTSSQAVVWVTHMYYEKALKEIDSKHWTLFLNGLPNTPTIEEFLLKELQPNSRVGVNPLYISLDSWKKLKKLLSIAGHTLVPVSRDLVDVIREEQGVVFKPSQEKLFVLDLKYAGQSLQEKVQDVRETIKRRNVFGIIISKLDELAWLFNLRGRDITYNFVFYGFALITADQISLFVDESKVTDDVRSHLNVDEKRKNEEKVKIRPYEDIKEAVMELNKMKKNVWVSPDVSAAIGTLLDEDRTWMGLTPVGRRKVVKNPVEVQGMRQCHIRDAVGLCEFWSWLEQEVPKGHVTEALAAQQLEDFCRQQRDFLDSSFKTGSFLGDGLSYDRSASGKTLTDKGLYFSASGRHYLDGTTNISRAMHYGTPSPWHRECYTRVLKGHINLAKTVFPSNTTGHALDVISRKALWDVGLDFLHFSGHGVGHVLHVMEGPYGIGGQSLKARGYHSADSLTWEETIDVELPLSSEMFVTIEPGFYEEGLDFMFRLENMFVVMPVELKNNHKNRGFLKFEPVSFLPFSRKMLVMALLTNDEIDWLDAYHADCLSKVGPVLKEYGKKEALDWLIAETKPLREQDA